MTFREPLVTIGITCYNEGDWLLECWESVLAQTDDRWIALLIMDGGANQRTQEVYNQLEHPKLRKYAKPVHAGPHPTRNKAFELTDTQYHFTLDGDDQLLPESVAIVLDAFSQHPEAGFVYGDYECFGGREELWRFTHEVTQDILVERQIAPGASCYKKQAWERVGGYAPELALGNADYDFFIGLFEAGIIGYHCGKIIYRYRLGHLGQVSRSYEKRYHETHEIIVQRHPRFFSNRQHRNRFLALGYRRSAKANYIDKNFKYARKLALSAMLYGMWPDIQFWQIMLSGKLPLPPWAHGSLRNVCHQGKQVVNFLIGKKL